MIKKVSLILVCLLLWTFLGACGPSQAEVDAQATQLAANLVATQTAKAPTLTPAATSTNTPLPTATSVPPTNTPTLTDTPVPPTNTSTPTATPVPPTNTSTPTDTPVPPTATSTPTPAPPTATPAPLPTPTSTLGIGSTQVRERDGAIVVYVPAGEFLMGNLGMVGDDYVNSASVKEWPQHTVYLDVFWIDQTEVTNIQYNQCVVAGVCEGGNAAPEWADFPVTNVNWNQAKTYCEWVGGRLPTEAEWEKAARGTDGRTYPWGEGIDCDHARYAGAPNCGNEILPVGSLPAGASPYGALDMAGNAAEWTADWMDVNYYESSPRENPTGPDVPPENPKGFKLRVARSNHPYFFHFGGSMSPTFQRTTNRSGVFPDEQNASIGFRCVQSQ